MAKRKPRIEYKWRTRQVTGHCTVQEVTWSLYGLNGEYMCGSGSEGYRDKTDARRAVRSAIYAMAFGAAGDSAVISAREVGPGKKPQ